jgi:hypothetical protein
MVLTKCHNFSAVAAELRGEGWWYALQYIVYGCMQNVTFPAPGFFKVSHVHSVIFTSHTPNVIQSGHLEIWIYAIYLLPKVEYGC